MNQPTTHACEAIDDIGAFVVLSARSQQEWIHSSIHPVIQSFIHRSITWSMKLVESLNQRSTTRERERDTPDTVPSGPQWFMSISFAQSIQ